MHREAPHSLQSPLHMASEAGDLKLTQFILQHMESASWNLNANGKTPIHVAAMYGHLEVVKLLAPLIESTKTSQYMGWTPLQLAAMNGCTEVVKVLATFCENANAPQYGGWTPMQLAAENGHTGVVKALATLTDKPNAPGQGNWTPIQLAAENGHTEVVKVLASFTDSPNTPGDPNGRSPIRLAIENGHSDVVKALVSCPSEEKRPKAAATSWSFDDTDAHYEIVRALVASPMPPKFRQNLAAKRRSYTPMTRRRNALVPLGSTETPDRSRISFKTTTCQVTFDPKSPPCTVGLTKRVHKIPIKCEKPAKVLAEPIVEKSSSSSSNSSSSSSLLSSMYTPYSTSKVHTCKRATQQQSRVQHHQSDRSTFRSA